MKSFATMAIVILTLFFAIPAFAQTSCVQLGQFVSCQGPNGQSFEQLQLNRNQGVITDSRGNVEPYTILPPRPEPVRPLNDVLPRYDRALEPRTVMPFAYETPSAPVFLYGTEGP